MIDSIFRAVGSAIRSTLIAFRVIKNPDFVARHSEDRPGPSDLQRGEIVIVGSGKLRKWACFPCPDGCGEMVSLNLSAARRPSWSIKSDWLSRVTIHPSVHEKAGCRSHYWIKGGRVIWCQDSGNGELRHDVYSSQNRI